MGCKRASSASEVAMQPAEAFPLGVALLATDVLLVIPAEPLAMVS